MTSYLPNLIQKYSLKRFLFFNTDQYGHVSSLKIGDFSTHVSFIFFQHFWNPSVSAAIWCSEFWGWAYEGPWCKGKWKI